jgi:hypothetical protein
VPCTRELEYGILRVRLAVEVRLQALLQTDTPLLLLVTTHITKFLTSLPYMHVLDLPQL